MAEPRMGRDDAKVYIPPAKLSDLDTDAKIDVFWRPDKTTGQVKIMSGFPRQVAEAFSPYLTKDIARNGGKYAAVMGPDKEAFKKIFDYMLDCVFQGKSVNYPFNEINPFTEYPVIIDAARRLRMNQLEDGLATRARLLGRKKLIEIVEAETILENYYCSHDDKMYDIAVESIAYGWYDNRFEKDDDYDLDVGYLRETYPVFDELLSKKIEKIPGEIQETKEAARIRKAEREARERGEAVGDNDENGGTGGSAGGGWNEDTQTAGTGSGWDNAPDAAARGTGGTWDGGNDSGFQSADATPGVATQDVATGGQSWADEPETVAVEVASVPSVHGPSSGW